VTNVKGHVTSAVTNIVRAIEPSFREEKPATDCAMASLFHAALCALLAAAFWPLLGYAVGRHLLPRPLARGAAPVLGWAIHSAALLPIYCLLGFSPIAVLGSGALCVVAAAVSLARPAAPVKDGDDATIPVWAFAAAALLALVPAAAILPKFYGGAVQLADPIFDHSKIAIVDAMTRLGLPPVNPVFGEFGAPGHLAYYYLWHFSAAELAQALGASGWEADIGLTWFTAFASLSLMMAIAVWLGKRAGAAVWVVVLAAAASLWVTLAWLLGGDDFVPWLWPPIGMAGWLFQATWVPQHLMAASCAVMAMLTIVQYTQRQRPALLFILALLVVAGFESSTYVGGVTFGIAALVAAPILIAATAPARRLHFVAGLAIAAALAVGLAAPFVLDQLATLHARGNGSPLIVAPYHVLGPFLPPWPRHLLDLPAYWLILLPLELPAAYCAGAIALAVALRSAMPRPEKLAVAALTVMAGAGLVISWLLASTLGDNNDLGLRAIVPAEMILIVAAAAGCVGGRGRARAAIVATALAGLALSLPDTVGLIRSNIAGEPNPGGDIFAQTPELWAAVRRHAAPQARVANNPLFLRDLTAWPVNISWALLADRSSCFAGEELALAFAPLSPARRHAIQAQFVRVFAGDGSAADVGAMAKQYGCEVVVVVPQDGAWRNDPFAAGPDYRLAETRDGRWRIYVRTAAARAAP
jgi:hypothetical protein